MRRIAALLIVTLFAVAACGSSTSTPTGAAASGTQKASGTAANGNGGGSGKTACGGGTYLTFKTQTFCGPASATATLNGKSYTVTGGTCEETAQGYLVNIGTIVIQGKNLPADAPRYFAVLDQGDGATATGNLGGEGFAAPTTLVKIAADKKSGSVKGKLAGGGTIDATFTCS